MSHSIARLSAEFYAYTLVLINQMEKEKIWEKIRQAEYVIHFPAGIGDGTNHTVVLLSLYRV